MARNGMLIVDVDAHYLEPLDEIADYMDEPWRTRVKHADGRRMLPTSLGDRMVESRIRRDDVPYGKTKKGDVEAYGMGAMAPDQIANVMHRIDIAPCTPGQRCLAFLRASRSHDRCIRTGIKGGERSCWLAMRPRKR